MNVRAAAVLLVVIGCGSSSGGGSNTAANDGGSSGTSSSSGGSSSSSSSGGSSSGGSPALADGGACVALTSSAGRVPITWSADAPPAPAGGAITDGTYVLTAVKRYGVSAAPGGDNATETVVFRGGYQEYADGDPAAGAQNIGRTYAISSANELTFTEICHTPVNLFASVHFTKRYTATASAYVEYSDDLGAARATLYTFTRQ